MNRFSAWFPAGVILLAVLKASGHWDPLPWIAVVGILFVPTVFSIIINILNLLLVFFATWHFVRSVSGKEGSGGDDNTPSL